METMLDTRPLSNLRSTTRQCNHKPLKIYSQSIQVVNLVKFPTAVCKISYSQTYT